MLKVTKESERMMKRTLPHCDISVEYAFVQDELGLNLTSDEEAYVFQCFHQAVWDELKHKRWK